jgi:hypothetical protein
MTIGTSLLRRNFSSVAHLDRPHHIDISSTDLLFEHFEQHWTFEPASDSGNIVEYRLDLKFRSRLLQMLIGGSLADRAVAMVAAFRRRACELYSATRGKASSVMMLFADAGRRHRSSRDERTGDDFGAKKRRCNEPSKVRTQFQALLLKRAASSEPPVVSPAL